LSRDRARAALRKNGSGDESQRQYQPDHPLHRCA
jgi:hypothetical protein